MVEASQASFKSESSSEEASQEDHHGSFAGWAHSAAFLEWGG